MFCKNCGKQLDDSANFCDGCGANLQEVATVTSNKISKMLNDGKDVFKNFFSKNPANAIDIAKNADSWIGGVILTIATILFSLMACLNITQSLNSVLDSINDKIYTMVVPLLGKYGDQIGEYLPKFKMSFLIELFIPFFFLTILVGGVIFGICFLSLKIKKKSLPDIKCFLNMLGATSLPLITTLILNLILGFIFPVATIAVFAVGAVVSVVFVYEMIKSFYDSEYKPLIEITAIVSGVLLIGMIFIAIAVTMIGDELMNTFTSELGRMVDDGANFVNGIFSSLF